MCSNVSLSKSYRQQTETPVIQYYAKMLILGLGLKAKFLGLSLEFVALNALVMAEITKPSAMLAYVTQ